MTEEQIKEWALEKAKEYVRDNAWNFDEIGACQECIEYGYYECKKEHDWHDLQKDPTDLPKNTGAKLVVIDYGALGLEYGVRANMNDPIGRKDVIKWKEIE